MDIATFFMSAPALKPSMTFLFDVVDAPLLILILNPPDGMVGNVHMAGEPPPSHPLVDFEVEIELVSVPSPFR